MQNKWHILIKIEWFIKNVLQLLTVINSIKIEKKYLDTFQTKFWVLSKYGYLDYSRHTTFDTRFICQSLLYINVSVSMYRHFLQYNSVFLCNEKSHNSYT